jgi:cation diffusion facilitator CzcD-associated flavoprotein CzcO
MVADPDDVDVVIVGGGHNGLVAAAYLAGAGLRVRLLERLQHVGGAAVSLQVFDGRTRPTPPTRPRQDAPACWSARTARSTPSAPATTSGPSPRSTGAADW